MTRTVSRMFTSHATAKKAAQDLMDANFRDVHVFTGEGKTCALDDHIDTMTQAYLLKSHAKAYAEGLGKGQSVVAVHAPWGSQDEAAAILDSYDSVDAGIPRYKVKSVAWNERTPMSSAMIAPVLTKTARPFEKIWNVRSDTKKVKHVSQSMLGMGLLSKKSLKLGKKHLSDRPTPLSSRLGLPLLAKKRHYAVK